MICNECKRELRQHEEVFNITHAVIKQPSMLELDLIFDPSLYSYYLCFDCKRTLLK